MSVPQTFRGEFPQSATKLPVAGTFREHGFDTHLIRGRNEREVGVFVTYRVTPASIEIVSVKGADDLNTYEWDQIEQDAADDYADADLEAAVSYSRSTIGMAS